MNFVVVVAVITGLFCVITWILCDNLFEKIIMCGGTLYFVTALVLNILYDSWVMMIPIISLGMGVGLLNLVCLTYDLICGDDGESD